MSQCLRGSKQKQRVAWRMPQLYLLLLTMQIPACMLSSLFLLLGSFCKYHSGYNTCTPDWLKLILLFLSFQSNVNANFLLHKMSSRCWFAHFCQWSVKRVSSSLRASPGLPAGCDVALARTLVTLWYKLSREGVPLGADAADFPLQVNLKHADAVN